MNPEISPLPSAHTPASLIPPRPPPPGLHALCVRARGIDAGNYCCVIRGTGSRASAVVGKSPWPPARQRGR